MKWYERIWMKFYIYSKSILWVIYFFLVGHWFLKVDNNFQKKEDEKLLKQYEEAKEMRIREL